MLHNFHPKNVDLSKVFLKPKNEYEVLQNYKLLSGSFVKLGWKKFEAERYSKRREKDYLSLAQVLRKVLSTRSIKEGLLQGHLDTTLEEFRSEEEPRTAPHHNQLRALRILRLEKTKKDLLARLTRLQLLLADDDPDRSLPALHVALLAIVDGADTPN